MCRPRVGEANQLFSVCIALWRPTALAKIYNAVGRQRNLGLALSRKFWTLFKIKTDQVLVNLLWLCYTDSDWMSCITCICICYSTLANFIIRHRYKTAPTIITVTYIVVHQWKMLEPVDLWNHSAHLGRQPSSIHIFGPVSRLSNAQNGCAHETNMGS